MYMEYWSTAILLHFFTLRLKVLASDYECGSVSSLGEIKSASRKHGIHSSCGCNGASFVA